MSKVNKRKHVMKEMQTDDFDPPESNQRICRILGSRGNNLHEVESAEPFTGTTSDTMKPTAIPPSTDTQIDDDEKICQFLVSMPTKFRKNVWVKRGDFVIVEPIDEGDKVKAEIVRILTTQHVKEFKKMDVWPEKFTSKDNYRASHQCPNDDDADDSDNDNDLFVNTNRAHHEIESNGESQDSSDSDSTENSDTDGSDADSEDNGSDSEETETQKKTATGKISERKHVGVKIDHTKDTA